MKRELSVKFRIIEEYQKHKNLKIVAQNFNVHPSTIYRWLKKHKDNQCLFYHRPWNRLPQEIETKIMLLKENKPNLTLHQAKNLLKQEGITISIKGIYDVWNRYNLLRRLKKDPFSHFCEETLETKSSLDYVRYLLKNDKSPENLKRGAEILNRLPAYPIGNDDVILTIPEHLLSLRRRFDRLYIQFSKMPTPEFYKKINRLRCQMEKDGLLYSSIIAGLSEILALHWMRTPEKELRLNELLNKRKGRLRDPVLNFLLTFLAATAEIELVRIDRAKRLIHKTQRLLKNLHHAIFYESMGDVMSFLSDYSSSFNYHRKALETAEDEDERKRLLAKIGIDLALAGRYRKAGSYLKLAKINANEIYYESYCLARALSNFGLGRIEQCMDYLQKTLEKSEKEQLRNTIFTTICCNSALYMAMGEKEKAYELLNRYLKLIKKYRLNRETMIMENLLAPDSIDNHPIKLPTIYLLYLLKKAKNSLKVGDYLEAVRYAQKYGLTGYLHRCVFFLPELILHHLDKGRGVMLPKSLIQLPVFNKNFPFYELKFLGATIIYRNHSYLKIKINPQMNAFLINLGLNLREPGKSIPVEDTIKNFWQRSSDPLGRLYHLLVQTRDALKLPSHFLSIENIGNKKFLVNKGFYIWTDYNYFEIQLAQAKALERAGEWGFARKEYLRAFNLFRGEPFKKNFDDWSVNMRFKILSQLETEAINFAKSCLEHRNKTDARHILEKVLKVIPDSEEIRKLLDG